MANVRVKALRGFRGLVGQEFRVVTAGEVVDVAAQFARELIGTGKAVAEQEGPAADGGAESNDGASRGARARGRGTAG